MLWRRRGARSSSSSGSSLSAWSSSVKVSLKIVRFLGSLLLSEVLVNRDEISLTFFGWGFLMGAAIGACKQQLSATGVTECNNNGGNGQSECSEQTWTEGTPVLEEFIPMKRLSRSEDCEDDDVDRHSHKQMKINNDNDGDKGKSGSVDSKKKSDWLKSAQLWNQSPDPPPKEVINFWENCFPF